MRRFEFQIEHHLFPNICHVHYKAISKIVKETAEEFGLPYNSGTSFTGALDFTESSYANLEEKILLLQLFLFKGIAYFCIVKIEGVSSARKFLKTRHLKNVV